MPMAVEFDCRDCGRHVVAYGGLGPDLERCSICFWIAENIAPEEQAAVRDQLGVPMEPAEIREPLEWPD
jgi:hypothetical protein